jgi:hypothetical protein
MVALQFRTVVEAAVQVPGSSLMILLVKLVAEVPR